MPLVLNEEQRMLRDTAREFLQSNAPIDLLRTLRDEDDPAGYSEAVWQKMVEMGWPAIAIDEAYGGLGFGYVGLGAVVEECGRTLVGTPFFGSVILSASIISLGGSEAQKQQYLPNIAAGQSKLALAHEETHHHNPLGAALLAKADGEDFVLSGAKVFVADGTIADHIIVSARTAGQAGDENGISLFILDRQTEGVSATLTRMIDSRNCARIHFDNVRVNKAQLIGELDNGFTILDQALDRGRICLAAEMLGGCQVMFDQTIEYLKDREQFGKKIGSFQALQHRAAIMFAELEQTRSVVAAALPAIDEQSDETALLASMAKIKANDTFDLITSEAVQMHGGIGVTDEMNIGFYFKRARLTIHRLGDSGFHRDRFASINGY